MAFAAPRTEGIWDDVRGEIAQEPRGRQGTVDEQDGPFGPELHGDAHGRRPAGADGDAAGALRRRRRAALVPARAVHRPPRVTDEAVRPALEGVSARVVVVRGGDPMAPGDPLPLRVPERGPEDGRSGEPEDAAGRRCRPPSAVRRSPRSAEPRPRQLTRPAADASRQARSAACPRAATSAAGCRAPAGERRARDGRGPALGDQRGVQRVVGEPDDRARDRERGQVRAIRPGEQAAGAAPRAGALRRRRARPGRARRRPSPPGGPPAREWPGGPRRRPRPRPPTTWRRPGRAPRSRRGARATAPPTRAPRAAQPSGPRRARRARSRRSAGPRCRRPGPTRPPPP